MINIIYGAKGSGKTAEIIKRVNEKAETGKGCVVYITDRKDHSVAISNKVRFILIQDYGITCEKCCVPFLKGLIAGNYDITDVYVDGLARFIGMKVEDMEKIYTDVDLLSSDHNVDFTFTVSVAEVPSFMKKYI